MENLSSVIFYNIEEAIKTYRMYAQNQLKINDLKITIDQWLVLKCLKENPNATQIELAEKVFKAWPSTLNVSITLTTEDESNPPDKLVPTATSDLNLLEIDL